MAAAGRTNVILYIYDSMGNVRHKVRAGDGSAAVTATYEYDPFGRLLYAEPPPAYETAPQFLFSTKLYESHWQQYYYGYRYYSPDLGRWLSRDPSKIVDDIGTYVFVRNNCSHYVDPYGLQEKKCGGDVTHEITRIRRILIRRVRSMNIERLFDAFVRLKGQQPAHWDITFSQQADKCPCGDECVETVTIANKCHGIWDVNYILYGVIWKVMTEHITATLQKQLETQGSVDMDPSDAMREGRRTMHRRITIYKAARKPKDNWNNGHFTHLVGSQDALLELHAAPHDWADVGYGGVRAADVKGHRRYRKCKPCTAKGQIAGAVLLDTEKIKF